MRGVTDRASVALRIAALAIRFAAEESEHTPEAARLRPAPDISVIPQIGHLSLRSAPETVRPHSQNQFISWHEGQNYVQA